MEHSDRKALQNAKRGSPLQGFACGYVVHIAVFTKVDYNTSSFSPSAATRKSKFKIHALLVSKAFRMYVTDRLFLPSCIR